MTICGCYIFVPPEPPARTSPFRRYLPLVSLKAQTTVVASTARTTLTQTFVNPLQDKPIQELRYTFPLYDGVSVVGFVCTINNERVIRGRVKEKDAARRDYKEAVDRGETAGLLEQLPQASDVFSTTVGNVPAAAEVRVDITYLGELKHDAEADGFRFTLPTAVAPRYGPAFPGELLARPSNVVAAPGIEIVVDVELPTSGGNHIKSIKSPSHPVSVEMKVPDSSARAMSAARAEISIPSLQLEKDVVLIVVPAKPESPSAVLEQHPSIPSQRALMATFVPRFNLPQSRPEIVFVCDRSGSMGSGRRIPNLKAALHVFLRSLPVGVKFNIVSFGSSHSFLFERSRSYDQTSLDEASRHVDTFDSDFGGTEMYAPIDEVFRRRYADMDLEVFCLTDGEVWDQSRLFDMVNENVRKSQGAARLFTLGIGDDVSHSLVEGLARAGKGFAQIVGDNEKFNAKVVRMLKASLSPHIDDYSFELQYGSIVASAKTDKPSEDDFEMVETDTGDGSEVLIEKVMDALVLGDPTDSGADGPGKEKPPPAYNSSDKSPMPPPQPAPPISLFSAEADPDQDTGAQAASSGGVDPKYAHLPAIPVPRMIQAPFEIPPMYNFNRVSIYLLLGPSSPQRVPRAVVLRGTSRKHGPVELSIPVQVLPHPGETVHQLAAKKAVQDLEEGRGWLVHAKDAADGRLLREKNEGRFGDMVEREAVRLGVAFQVGGKWCSFVAVDDKTSKAEVAPQVVQEPPEPMLLRQSNSAPRYRMMRAAAPAPMAPPPMTMALNSFAGPPAAPPPPPAPAAAAGLFSVSSAMPAESAAAPRPLASVRSAPKSSGFNLGSFGPISRLRSASPGKAVESESMLAFGAPGGGAAGAPATKVSSAAKVPERKSLFGKAFGSSRPSRSSPSASERRKGAAAEEREEAPQLSAGLKKEKKKSSSPCSGGYSMSDADEADEDFESEGKASSDPLPSLVRLQAFEGFWDWSAALYATLGLTEDAVAKVLPTESANGRRGATACAVAFLRKKMAGSADEWEMLVDKAVSWLQGQGGEVEELLAAAEKLF